MYTQVTEHEIIKGINNLEDGKNNVFVFFRKIVDLDEDNGKLLDKNKKIDQLYKYLENTLPQRNRIYKNVNFSLN